MDDGFYCFESKQDLIENSLIFRDGSPKSNSSFEIPFITLLLIPRPHIFRSVGIRWKVLYPFVMLGEPWNLEAFIQSSSLPNKLWINQSGFIESFNLITKHSWYDAKLYPTGPQQQKLTPSSFGQLQAIQTLNWNYSPFVLVINLTIDSYLLNMYSFTNESLLLLFSSFNHEIQG